MDYFPESYVDVDGKALTKEEAIGGYKLVMVVYSAAWWPGCTPFKTNLKEIYQTINADGAKNLQVVLISGDQNEDGFNKSTAEMPWVAVPLGGDKGQIESKVPCTGYPTPGIINGVTGEVFDADAFGKVSEDSMNAWLAKVWDEMRRTQVRSRSIIQVNFYWFDECSGRWIMMSKGLNLIESP